MADINKIREDRIAELNSMVRAMKRGTAEQKKQKKQNKPVVRIKFNAAGALSRLAEAKTKGRVSALERYVRVQLRTASKNDDVDKEMIRQMKKVLQKTRSKLKALTKEEQMENSRRIARNAENRREEQKITQELIKKRRARKGKERADVGDAAMQDLLSKKRELREARFENNLSGTELQGSTIDVQCDSFETATGEAEAAAVVAGITIDTVL